MEPNDPPFDEKNIDADVLPGDEPIFYPPKYRRGENTSSIWLRSLTSLALYLILGYYLFKQWEILLLITAIVLIHELGHFFAMKFFNYKDLGIFFIPLLGAYVSGNKREVSQKQSAIILLAGPLPGIAIGIILYLVDQNGSGHYFMDISYSRMAMLFILLNLINLFPIYPLDGGQLLNRVFLDEDSIWSKIFIFLSIGLMAWFSINMYLSSGSYFYFVFLLFPLTMLFRLAGEKKLTTIENRIEAEGIPLDIDYDDMPDKDYWKARNIIIEEHPGFSDVPTPPPYEFNSKEEKIMTTIQNLLHRHLIQDLSIAGKLFVFLIWIAAIASPWLINMDMSFFRRFGF